MEEIWKSFGYDGYEVSNFGRVKSYKYDKINGKIMKPYHDTKGYLQIDISLDGRKRENRVHLVVHRLVAQAFIPNPNNLPQVNHKDENKENNHVDNLEWCTNEYNARYGTHAERVAQKRRIPIYSIDNDGNVEYFAGVRVAARVITGNPNASGSEIGRAIKKMERKLMGAYGIYRSQTNNVFIYASIRTTR